MQAPDFGLLPSMVLLLTLDHDNSSNLHEYHRLCNLLLFHKEERYRGVTEVDNAEAPSGRIHYPVLFLSDDLSDASYQLDILLPQPSRSALPETVVGRSHR